MTTTCTTNSLLMIFLLKSSSQCCFLHYPLISPCSADERFDATFHTNVLVNATGSCQYIPPGETFTALHIKVSVSIAFNIYGCSYCFLTIFGIFSHQNCFIIIMAKWLKVKNLVESGVKQFPITSFQAFWRVPATSMCGGSHLMCRSVTWSLAPGPTMAGCWTSKW